jgi:hypothetical protein
MRLPGSLLCAGALAIGALATLHHSARATDIGYVFCYESSMQFNGKWSTVHSFGPVGACYAGSPVARHSNANEGYCHDDHNDC